MENHIEIFKPAEHLHIITKEDVDKFLENVKNYDEYVYEKLSQVAHRRLVRTHTLVPAGLSLCMSLLLADLACGVDGYDKKAYMPQLPMANMLILPSQYPDLWNHLPANFIEEMRVNPACQNPDGCRVM